MLTSNRETTGFLLSVVFVCLAAGRDVYFGALFQRVHPLAVALTAFTLCTLVFLPVALARDRAGLTRLRAHAGTLAWINATTAIAWLSFFHALRIAEPALVQVVFFGIGPLAVAWIDRFVPGVAPAARTAGERRLHLGLLGALLFAAGVMLGGASGLGPQPLGRILTGLALTVGGGVCISISTLLGHAGRDRGGVGAPDRAAELRQPDRHRARFPADRARGDRGGPGAGLRAAARGRAPAVVTRDAGGVRGVRGVRGGLGGGTPARDPSGAGARYGSRSLTRRRASGAASGAATPSGPTCSTDS
jgi:hypothetical protein